MDVSDLYDSSTDPTAGGRPSMAPWFRPLDPGEAARVMGLPPAFHLVESVPEMSPERTPITHAEFRSVLSALAELRYFSPPCVDDRAEKVGAAPPFTVEEIGGSCPTQATGRFTGTDRPFYFRARHGGWTLQIGNPGWPTDYCEWPQDLLPPLYETVSGLDWTGGAMSDASVLGIIAANVPTTDGDR